MIRICTSVPLPPAALPVLPSLESLTGLKEDCVFYDIETTGTSVEKANIYLIGMGRLLEKRMDMVQLFAEDLSEEADILKAFQEELCGASSTVQYNGSSFDQPFIRKKCSLYGLSCILDSLPALDLYRSLSGFKSVLGLSSLRQRDLEERLGGTAREFPDGRKGISLYKAYLRDPEEVYSNLLIGHNREDLSGMGLILSCFSLEQLRRGMFHVLTAGMEGESVSIRCSVEVPFPTGIQLQKDGVHLDGEGSCFTIRLIMKDGRLRKYYPDYKNYDYLPAEDTAIPKSLGKFMDRSLRKPAVKETCYTWFPVTDAFLADRILQYAVVRDLLPVILNN